MFYLMIIAWDVFILYVEVVFLYIYLSRTVVRLLKYLSSLLCFVHFPDAPVAFSELKCFCEVLLPKFRELADEEDPFVSDPES